MEMHRIEKFFVNTRIFNYFHNKFLVSKFLKGIRDNPKNILEIGCGIGYTTKSLSQRFQNAKIIAVDYDDEQIKLAKKMYGKLKNVEFMQGDAAKLKFKNSCFDAIFEFNVLHHIKFYEKAIEEISRVLKRGKRFYVMDVSKYFFFPLFEKLFPPEAYFIKEEVIKDMQKNELKIIKSNGKILFSIIAVRN